MSLGIIFAIITAISFGLWNVFHQQASAYVNPLLGAILIGLIEAIVGGGLLLIFQHGKSTTLITNQKGLLFIFVIGILVIGLDYFALRTYNAGIPISVAGPIIIGGSIAVTAIVGFFMGDTFSFLKFFGLILVVLGASILSALGK